MLSDILMKWGAEEVAPIDLYRDMFRLGEGLLQKENEASGSFKTNPVAICRKDGRMHRRIMFEDTFEELLEELKGMDWAFMNGCTYFGRTNSSAHASKMYAMIFDLDGVTDATLKAFLSGAYGGEAYPIPNYIVLSGHGIHLYYIFEYPIPLYPNLKLQLKDYKYALTDRIWNAYTSEIEKPQHQGINQAFRVPGTKTKDDSEIPYAQAYRLHQHLFCFDQLNMFVPKKYCVDEKNLYKESRMSLAEAKRKYPDWYQRRVIEKRPPGIYVCKKDLYDWWIRQIREGAAYHHRYFCVMCLAIYAIKCDVDERTLATDINSLMPFLNSLQPDKPFTWDDVNSALECYDERYRTFPAKDIAKISGIPITPSVPRRPKGKRLDQKTHLKRARIVQEFDYPDGEWRNKDGRPPKSQIVWEWRLQHPGGRKADCIRDTGLDKKTVYKWWDGFEDEFIKDTFTKEILEEEERERYEKWRKILEEPGNIV